jgi:hypothetical protein
VNHKTIQINIYIIYGFNCLICFNEHLTCKISIPGIAKFASPGSLPQRSAEELVDVIEPEKIGIHGLIGLRDCQKRQRIHPPKVTRL